jgi:two-component system nitrogen regulation response regulator NtrX
MGAFDYIEKPFGEERIIVCVARCLDFNRLANDKEKLEERIKGQEILGNHPAIQEVLRLVGKVAPTNGRVLITGESGTGKELVARAIHRQSVRSDKPLIKVNCAAIPANLIESELFGHEKGSFTGAVKQRKGVFERADGGTLFLDEIGELTLEVQAKLLRALQNGEIQRVGGEKLITVDVRLLAATNRDLGEMVQHGEYREDLFYRLNVVTLHLPPLRQRVSDIITLADVFLKEACQEHALGEKHFSPMAKKQLETYSWPGNIRELRNIVERTAILSEEALIEAIEGITTGAIGGRSSPFVPPSDRQDQGMSRQVPVMTPGESGVTSGLSGGGGYAPRDSASSPNGIQGLQGQEQSFSFSSNLTSWQDFHELAGRAYLKYVLKATQGNVSEAARLLCLERAYLHRLMKKLGIQREIVVCD